MPKEKDLQVTCSSLLDGAKTARGVAVIVDVFRAFSCTSLLFCSQGDPARGSGGGA